MQPFIRTPFNYDTNIASDDAGIDNFEPSLTQQSFQDEADINVMLTRYGFESLIQSNPNPALAQDFTTSPHDFHEACELVRTAQESFAALPPQVRARFDNDPVRLMRFIDDSNNYEEALRLGIVVKRPPADEEGLSMGRPPSAPHNAGDSGRPVGKAASKKSAATRFKQVFIPVEEGDEGEIYEG